MQDVHRETWLIFYDDIRLGTIAERAGVPLDLDRWGWSLGFYPKRQLWEDTRGYQTASTRNPIDPSLAKNA
jgi:hypothetical protein